MYIPVGTVALLSGSILKVISWNFGIPEGWLVSFGDLTGGGWRLGCCAVRVAWSWEFSLQNPGQPVKGFAGKPCRNSVAVVQVRMSRGYEVVDEGFSHGDGIWEGKIKDVNGVVEFEGLGNETSFEPISNLWKLHFRCYDCWRMLMSSCESLVSVVRHGWLRLASSVD